MFRIYEIFHFLNPEQWYQIEAIRTTRHCLNVGAIYVFIVRLYSIGFLEGDRTDPCSNPYEAWSFIPLLNNYRNITILFVLHSLQSSWMLLCSKIFPFYYLGHLNCVDKSMDLYDTWRNCFWLDNLDSSVYCLVLFRVQIVTGIMLCQAYDAPCEFFVTARAVLMLLKYLHFLIQVHLDRFSATMLNMHGKIYFVHSIWHKLIGKIQLVL